MHGVTAFALGETPLLSRTVVERAEELRSDVDALRAGWATAKLLRIDRRGQAPVDGSVLVLADATELGPEPVSGAVFLGVRDGLHVWAARVLAQTGTVADLRRVGEDLGDADADLMVSAVALLNWHDQAAFSAVDGSPSEPTVAGWSRISTVTGHEEFPRTDPAIICLVHDGDGRVLLARQRRGPSAASPCWRDSSRQGSRSKPAWFVRSEKRSASTSTTWSTSGVSPGRSRAR